MVDQDSKLTVAQRHRSALELRAKGMSYDAIAAELGYAGKSGAAKAVLSALNKIEAGGVKELRILEGERLDLLTTAIWKRAAGGNVGAVRAVLAIMERRAKLFGLDQPTKLEISRLLESEDWHVATETILRALEPFPDAAIAVAEALQSLDNE